MNNYVYILIAVLALVAIWFLFLRKKEDELPAKKEPEKLKAPAPKTKIGEREKEKESSKRKVPSAETVGETPAAKASDRPAAKERADEDEREEKPRPTPVEEEFGKGSVLDPALVRRGLAKTRGGMIARIADLIRGRKEIDPSLLQEIEEVLLTSDVGVKTASALIERMGERLKNKELDDEEKVWGALRAEARKILGEKKRLHLKGKPTIVMMVGVNGAGKTTTIGKLANKLKAQNKKVVLGAGDTFRAAAVQQLEVWGEREGAQVIKGKEGADPSSVLFDTVNAAKEAGADVVLCDTAGRLHTKSNLMDELKKVHRSLAKALEGAPHETLLVLDATNGQNALQQAKQFQEAIPLSGVVLTKLDGTAKGGVILAIADELKIPVRYIGIGERPADLREFDPDEFVEALFAGRESLSTEAA